MFSAYFTDQKCIGNQRGKYDAISLDEYGRSGNEHADRLEEYTVDKKYDMLLRNRQSILSEKIAKKASIHNTLITTYGIKNNEYRWSFDNVVTMEDLFA